MASSGSYKADYSRQQQLAGFGEQGQQALKQAHVLVIGAGGLGCGALPILGGAGVGRLTIVDHDKVEASNLHRQTLYRVDQLGQYKAELAAAYVQALNPEVTATAITRRLNATELLDTLAGVDLVLECTDDPAHKLRVNDAAVLLAKPAVFASAVNLEGQLQSFDGVRSSPCLRCLWPQVPTQVRSCAEQGVLGSVPAIMGNLQAHEALQLLTGVGQGLGSQVLYFDAADYRQRLIGLARAESCPVHSPDYDRAQFLASHSELEFEGSFDQAIAAGMVVVDIRDPSARQGNPLPVEYREALPDELTSIMSSELAELFERQPVLLVCYQGRTSLSLAAALRDQGYTQVFSKRGGAG